MVVVVLVVVIVVVVVVVDGVTRLPVEEDSILVMVEGFHLLLMMMKTGVEHFLCPVYYINQLISRLFIIGCVDSSCVLLLLLLLLSVSDYIIHIYHC